MVVSISRQSLVSLALKYDTDMMSMYRALSITLPQIGFDAVFETSLAQRISLIAAYEEFKLKYDMDASPKNTLLCSECPGWVCYAEK